MKYVFDKTVGRKLLYGTEWPIDVVVYKIANRQWMVAKLCNGTASNGVMEETKRSAIALAEQWVRNES